MTDPAVRLDIPHRDGCNRQLIVIKDDYLRRRRNLTLIQRRDSLGRRHPNAWRNWLTLICNDIECPAVVLVRCDTIEAIATAATESAAEGQFDGPIPSYADLADAAIAAHTEALKADGFVIVKLPTSPSEYWGPEHQPQWNHYPYTRVDGDEVEVGARCEHVYRINVAEARIFAADLLAAAEYAEAQR